MHPLYSTAKKTSGRRVKRHPSPLHNILQVARIRINDIETKGTLLKPPTWMQILIAKDREEAEQTAKDDKSDIKIYTDGSSHDGGVGMSAVLVQGI